MSSKIYPKTKNMKCLELIYSNKDRLETESLDALLFMYRNSLNKEATESQRDFVKKLLKKPVAALGKIPEKCNPSLDASNFLPVDSMQSMPTGLHFQAMLLDVAEEEGAAINVDGEEEASSQLCGKATDDINISSDTDSLDEISVESEKAIQDKVDQEKAKLEKLIASESCSSTRREQSFTLYKTQFNKIAGSCKQMKSQAKKTIDSLNKTLKVIEKAMSSVKSAEEKFSQLAQVCGRDTCQYHYINNAGRKRKY